MFETTDSISYINDAIVLVNNSINKAARTNRIYGNKSIFKDRYMGWIVEMKDMTNALYHKEIVLDEIYFSQYVCRLLKDIHRDRILRKQIRYKVFYRKTLAFMEQNIWQKWVSRGLRVDKNPYSFLMLSRTHMASHWAYIAAELYFLTTDSSRKTEYLAFVNYYNKELENNFHKYGDFITWNQTWDSLGHHPSSVQDVSHANLVVSYLVEAYDLGLWLDFDAIIRIINTLKYLLWDPQQCEFKDNIDESFHPGTEKGSFQADGFVKLTRYDVSLFFIYEKFVGCSKYLTAWYQYGQLFANLALSEKLVSSSRDMYNANRRWE
jgi:hypothetical protein